MKKIAIITMMILASALMLCACKENSGEAEDASKTDAVATVTGTEIDTGAIKTLCPDGWFYFAQRDTSGEVGEDGSYPVDANSMAFIKGGESEMDAFSKPTIYIYYNNYGFTEDNLALQQSLYAEYENIEYSINGIDCFAFTAKTSAMSETDYYENTIIFYPVTDSANVQFTIPTHWGADESVSLDDADVQAIINNFQVSAIQ